MGTPYRNKQAALTVPATIIVITVWSVLAPIAVAKVAVQHGLRGLRRRIGGRA